MPVEINSTSRFKAMLIAAGVLLSGLAAIFSIKYLMTRSENVETTSVESQD